MRRRDLLLGAGPLVLLVGCSQPDNRPAIIVGNAAPRRYKGAELDPARSYTLPETDLLDTSGASYNLRTGIAASPVTSPVTLLFFGYSNCPDVCTGIIADIATARNRIGRRSHGEGSHRRGHHRPRP